LSDSKSTLVSDLSDPTHNLLSTPKACQARFLRLAWLALAGLALGLFASSLPGYLTFYRQGMHNQPGQDVYHALSVVFSVIAFLVSFTLASLIFRRRWTERMAPFISFYLLLYGVFMAGPLEMWSLYWLGSPQIATYLQTILMTTPTIALMALFPNGRFTPSWTRGLVILSLGWVAFTVVVPFDQLYAYPGPMLAAFAAFFLTIFIPGLYAQIYRYRRVSSPAERQQTRWVVLGLIAWFLYIALSTGPYMYMESLPPQAPRPWWALATSLGWWVSLNILPLSLTIAVLRYRLWAVDVFINRAIVYAALTASVVGVYALAVGALGLLFHRQVDGFIALAATGLVAVLFQPMRERLQREVNRILYGQRDEPFAVLAQLGQRIENTLTAERMLPGLVETISQTLKLPYVAIAINQGGQVSIPASYGKPTLDSILFPLTYQGIIIGELRIARRAPGEEFSEAEMSLLANIAHQAGTAVHAIQLTRELQRSRQQRVSALEDERRRIRRDLHDGLGPRLAAHMLKVGSARATLGNQHSPAGSVLEELEDDLQETLRQIRELVYNLRPPALDQLGLAGAIRDYAEQINRGHKQQAGAADEAALAISVTTPERLPALPAAVEVAAYRIVQEALANIIHHARARRCKVELACSDALRLSISDDGIGLPAAYRSGVGLASMQERAAELGGSFQVRSLPSGGAQVQTVLPLHH
jgi:signal transduction histidine kinase